MSKKPEIANMKQCFVSALCPLVLDTPEAELLRSVKFAMDCGKTTVEYEGKVHPATEAYYRELCATFDFSPHVSWLECQLERGLMIVPEVAPRRLHCEVEVKCKCCGGVNFIDCGTHFTCRRCAVVRRKIHSGLAYREMASREYDYNGTSRQKNGRYSSSFNNLCELRGVPENIKRLNDQTQYASRSERKRDAQLYYAQETMESVCSRWQLPNRVAVHAHGTFCRLRAAMSRMMGQDELICACLMHALDKV